MPKVTNDDIKRELKDIKDALAKSDRKFRQSLWLTPMACGIALMIAGGSALFFAAPWVPTVLGVALFLYGVWGIIYQIKHENHHNAKSK
jgi:uncharacterized membrane protein HdeD (DUF308 family)